MRISDASRPQCRLVTPRAAPSACLIAYWVRRKAWKPSNTVSHASCVPLEGNGGAKRRSCRPDKGRTNDGTHERRNARIGMACQTHAAPLLYVHPHPTAARRAATLASSEREMHMGARTSSDRFRGVLRHEKSPRGNEYPNGLKTS